jgi:hypothetical protein
MTGGSRVRKKKNTASKLHLSKVVDLWKWSFEKEI